MPRDFRYTTQQARELFNKYGYMPADNFEFIRLNIVPCKLDTCPTWTKQK